MNKRRILIAVSSISFVVAAIAALISVAIAIFVDEYGRPVAVAATSALLFGVIAGGSFIATALVDQRRSALRQVDIGGGIERLDKAVLPLRGLTQMQYSLDSMERSSGELNQQVAALEGSVRVEANKPTPHSLSRATLDRRLKDVSFQLYRQIEARAVLEQRLEPSVALPPMRGWALSPDVALEVVDRILAGGIQSVLETGSGVSTVLMALALEKRGEGGRVVALEHDAEYAAASRRLLTKHGCAEIAEVVLAPLVSQPVDGETFEWYDLSAFDMAPTSVDLLLIDGPPASIGPKSRYPAVPLLRELMKGDSRIILDDANRSDEQAIVAEWSERCGVELVKIHHHEKGSAELSLVAGWSGPPSLRVPDEEPVEKGELSGAGESEVIPKSGDETQESTALVREPSRPLSTQEVPDSVWREKGGERSSFMYKLHESKRRKHLLPLLGHRQRLWAYNDKIAGYRLAESLGVAVPETYERSVDIGSIDWSLLPERFVIKPHNGAANRGVFLLEHAKAGVFRDLMDNQLKTPDDIARSYSGLVADGLVSARLALEELLAPRAELRSAIDIPDDLKIYCFYDRPTAVMQRRMFGEANRNKWRFKMWTNDWTDMGPVKYPDRYDSALDRPAGGEDVMEAAASIAKYLAVPFVRLDLFDTDRGAVFGEVSVHPGPPEQWADSADELLGWEWEMAEARLLADAILPSERRPNRG